MILKYNNQISLELKLLLLCLEDDLCDSKKDEIIEIFSGSIDWDKFKRLAIRHKVLPLIHVFLKKKYPEVVPVFLAAEFKKTFFLTSANNLYFTAILHKVIEFFDDSNIECVPLKGPVISEQLYGDINRRFFFDLDILVPVEKSFQAFSLLISKGFIPELNLNEKQFDAYMNSEDHIILSTGKRNVIVELHWELSARYLSKPFTFEQIRQQVQEYNFSGKKILTFSNADLLVYLCLHGSKHIWETLELIYLVATLLNQDLDWGRILTLAKTTHCYRKLLLGLSLCRYFFNCNLPKEIHVLIDSDAKVKELELYVIQLLLEPPENNAWESSKSKFTRYQFVALDRLQDKVRYLFFMVLFPTNNDWASITLTDKYSFLYYLTRPFRLFLKLLKRKSK
jgi:hypothetical protein